MVLLLLLPLLPLLQLAVAPATLLESGGVAVTVDADAGTYSVAVDGELWLPGGGASLPVASAGAPLRQVAPPTAVTRGTDTWGDYEKVEMHWGTTTGDVLLATSIRAYAATGYGQELVVFAQRWPAGYEPLGPTAAATADPNSVLAPFPTFSTLVPPDASTLNYFQWGGCQLANSFGGRWTNSSTVPGGGFGGKFGCQHGIPTVLYNASGRGAVLSPGR